MPETICATTRWGRFVAAERGEHGEESRSDGYQRICPQSGKALLPRAFDADQ